MKTIIVNPILHLTSNDLPSEMLTDILGDAEIEHLEIYEGNSAHLNDSINIDVLRGLLDFLEDKGANYVSIDFHTDHQELELDGLFITSATQEEIDSHNQKDKDFQINFCRTQIDNATRTKTNFEQQLKHLTGE